MTSTSVAGASGIYSKALDQSDFLKLMVAQLSAQDPLNPVKDTDFAAQMAQYSALEQNTAMQKNMASIQAAGLLGRQVEVKDSKGLTVTGVVSGVTMESGTPKITINGQTYDLGQVTSVKPIETQTPAAATGTETTPKTS